ncbi:unnamed protein product [Fraxinus pennsylvanica]|uniref:SPARK domain-containing protein n=1 Tax=Fraxinus pennsylvanica TaxID=56036 RepID=A0AAD2A359_9LAMI|nr:unnamed protein product [Fraxinus pennsylvanica]
MLAYENTRHLLKPCNSLENLELNSGLRVKSYYFWIRPFVALVVSSSPTSSTNSTTCLMDLGYVLRIPISPSKSLFDPTSDDPTVGKCECYQTLLSLYGLGLSQHLKETSLFELCNLPTSISCLEDFQSKLNSLFLPQNLGFSLIWDELRSDLRLADRVRSEVEFQCRCGVRSEGVLVAVFGWKFRSGCEKHGSGGGGYGGARRRQQRRCGGRGWDG